MQVPSACGTTTAVYPVDSVDEVVVVLVDEEDEEEDDEAKAGFGDAEELGA